MRSHEVKDEGYLVEHGGKTITVFSAPNYCDSMGNKGAFIHFDETCEPKFTQYEAVPHPSKWGAFLLFLVHLDDIYEHLFPHPHCSLADVRPMAYAAGMGGLFM